MSQIASSGNWFIDAASEIAYVTGQLFMLAIKTAIHNFDEFIHMSYEVLLIVAKFTLVVGGGMAMLIAAMFPTVAGQKSDYEQQLDNRAREKREQEWRRRRKEIEDKRSYDEERDKAFYERAEENYKRKSREIHEYNNNADLLNGPAISTSLLDVGNDVAVDDSMVKEINNLRIGVENGTEDPEKLREASEKLIKEREDKARKDARRYELHDKCRAKDFEADRLYQDADRKFKEGKPAEALDLYARGDSARRDANGLYNEYLAV